MHDFAIWRPKLSKIYQRYFTDQNKYVNQTISTQIITKALRPTL